jgi:hypothetical protein
MGVFSVYIKSNQGHNVKENKGSLIYSEKFKNNLNLVISINRIAYLIIFEFYLLVTN